MSVVALENVLDVGAASSPYLANSTVAGHNALYRDVSLVLQQRIHRLLTFNDCVAGAAIL